MISGYLGRCRCSFGALVRTCRRETSKPLGFGNPPVLSERDEFSSTGLRGHLDSV